MAVGIRNALLALLETSESHAAGGLTLGLFGTTPHRGFADSHLHMQQNSGGSMYSSCVSYIYVNFLRALYISSRCPTCFREYM